MENVVCKEITLPDHEDLTGTHICHKCHGKMVPFTDTHTFGLPLQRAQVKVSGIKAYKCEACGEIIYSSKEANLIETQINKILAMED